MSRKRNLKMTLKHDPSFKRLSRDTAKRLGFAPHTVYWSKKYLVLIVLLKKSSVGADYSLNRDALTAGCNMHHRRMAKRVYIAQVDPRDDPRNRPRLLYWKTALEVRELLIGETWRKGEFGPYLYVQQELFTVRSSTSTKEDDEWPDDVFSVGEEEEEEVDFEEEDDFDDVA